jgi:protein gp37
MKDSKIGWCHHSLNFWWGCNYVSAECQGCYAKTIMENKGREFNLVRLTDTWRQAFAFNAEAKRRRKSALVFTCSMSDFFHEAADRWRADAWDVIAQCSNLVWLILTKRPERIADQLPTDWSPKRYPHVWLGTTVGVRASYPRMDILRNIPAALRFLSLEPLLEDLHDINLNGYGWLLVGGMSGDLYQKKPMSIRWAANLFDKARALEIPYLFKQVSAPKSEWGINALGLYLDCRSDGVTWPILNQPRGNQSPMKVDLVRQFPETPLPLIPLDIERGHRFKWEEWDQYRHSNEQGTPLEAAKVLSEPPENITAWD